MSNSKRAQGNSRRRSARRTAAEEKWLYITTGLTGAAKAFTGNDMDDTREKIDIASEVNALQYKSIRNNDLFRAAHADDTDLLETFYKSITDYSVLSRPNEAGDTAFLLAVLYDSANVALSLLDHCPDLLNIVYTNEVYKGQHALHIATVNQNITLVKEFVRRGAKIDEPRATGSFFDPTSPDNQVYWGENILAFAACTGQKDIVDYLLRKGAKITVQDSQGNTVLHLLILQPDRNLARGMYEFIMSLKMSDDAKLEAIVNHSGLTPLQLAAFEGNKEIFSLILESRREVHWTYGPVTSSIYKLEELDSFEDRNSVLDVIVRSEADNAYELLNVQPIPQLLSEKWINYGFFFFMMWMFLYVGYMVIFTLVVFNRPLEFSNRTWCSCPDGRPTEFNSTCPCNGDIFGVLSDGNLTVLSLPCSTTSLKKRPVFTGAYSSGSDFLRLGGEIIVLVGAILSIFWEAPDLYRRGARGYFTSVGSGAFHVASWLFAILVFIALIMRLADAENEEVVLSWALICGWTFTFYFARAFQFLGPYIVMCQKMIAGDILRFWLIFTACSVGFCGALSNLFIEATPRPPEEWNSFTNSFITLFQLATGLTDVTSESYDTASSKNTVVIFLLVYLVIAFILLVNLLIATMGSTHARIEAERHGLWKKQLASVILLLERRVPARFRVRSGFDGGLVGLTPGEWYVRVEEQNSKTSSKEAKKVAINPHRLSNLPEGLETLLSHDCSSSSGEEDGDERASNKAPTPSPAKSVDSGFNFRRRRRGPSAFTSALLCSGGVGSSVATPTSVDTTDITSRKHGGRAQPAEKANVAYKKLPLFKKTGVFTRSNTTHSLTSPTGLRPDVKDQEHHSSLQNLSSHQTMTLDDSMDTMV